MFLVVCAVAVLCSLLAGPSDGALPPWSDDFDDGTLDGWSITEVGNGVVEVTTSQYVSASYSLHIYSPMANDAARLEPDVSVDNSRSYYVEMQFRYTGSHHWIELVKNYDMCVVLEGGKLIVRERNTSNRDVMSISANTWYHVKVLYNATSKKDTIWVNGVKKLEFDPDTEISILRMGDVYGTSNYGEAFYDDIKLYYEVPPSLPPNWLALPVFEAVEDVPLTQNFTAFVGDPDTPLDELYITSSSVFVTAISGLEVSFVFPNGVLDAVVPLVLNDRVVQLVADVNFTITPVNDPPTCSLPLEQSATEDEPMTLDFTQYLHDIDNAVSELGLVVSDPFATVHGHELVVLFPEDVLDHTVHLNVTDGLASTPVLIHFTVTPVDDPPIVDPLDAFSVAEGSMGAFNITPYLHDVDTPVEELRVMARDRNCTVQGQTLWFCFELGGLTVSVDLEVVDSHNRVHATLIVIVEEVNDAPIVNGISPKLFVEHEQKTVDLSPYIEDEDTPLGDLALECDDVHVVMIDGFNLTMLFTRWVPQYSVEFSVVDGPLRSNGTFEVQVQEVNDPPVIVGLSGLSPPVTVVVKEGEVGWYQLEVLDEDSSVFKYGVTSDWDAVTVFQNGSVRVTPTAGEVGNFTAELSVDDINGGIAHLVVNITVENVNDPPGMILILSPTNHTMVEELTDVTLAIDVKDPDVVLGQRLVVTWTSNVSGILWTIVSSGDFTCTTDSIPVGYHRITVTVSDGQYTRTAWFEMTVTERYVPPTVNPDDRGFLTGPTGIAVVALVIAIVVVVTAVVVLPASRRRREEAERTEAEAPEATSVTPARVAPGSGPVPAGEPLKMQGDLARLSANLGEMAAQLEAQRASEARTVPVAPPSRPAVPLEPVAVAPLSKEEVADRERTRELRDVMRNLTQLPQGLPTSLGGWDMAELARAVVDGERVLLPDGSPIVNIKGHWYNADRENVGTFMRESKGPEEAVSPTNQEDERVRRVERLEALLLEGKISEATYKDLKRKYESRP